MEKWVIPLAVVSSPMEATIQKQEASDEYAPQRPGRKQKQGEDEKKAAMSQVKKTTHHDDEL